MTVHACGQTLAASFNRSISKGHERICSFPALWSIPYADVFGFPQNALFTWDLGGALDGFWCPFWKMKARDFVAFLGRVGSSALQSSVLSLNPPSEKNNSSLHTPGTPLHGPLPSSPTPNTQQTLISPDFNRSNTPMFFNKSSKPG